MDKRHVLKCHLLAYTPCPHVLLKCHSDSSRRAPKLPSKQARRSTSVCRAVQGLLCPAWCQTVPRGREFWGCDGSGSVRIPWFPLSLPALTFVSDRLGSFLLAAAWGTFLETRELVCYARPYSFAIEAGGCALSPSGINAHFMADTSAGEEI